MELQATSPAEELRRRRAHKQLSRWCCSQNRDGSSKRRAPLGRYHGQMEDPARRGEPAGAEVALCHQEPPPQDLPLCGSVLAGRRPTGTAGFILH